MCCGNDELYVAYHLFHSFTYNLFLAYNTSQANVDIVQAEDLFWLGH